MNGEGVQLPLVDRPLVHCVLHRGIDQLAVVGTFVDMFVYRVHTSW